MTASARGCAWWVVVGKHVPRPCGAAVVCTYLGVPSCRKHRRGAFTAVAVVAREIYRVLDDAQSLSLDDAGDRAELHRRLVEALETPL